MSGFKGTQEANESQFEELAKAYSSDLDTPGTVRCNSINFHKLSPDATGHHLGQQLDSEEERAISRQLHLRQSIHTLCRLHSHFIYGMMTIGNACDEEDPVCWIRRHVPPLFDRHYLREKIGVPTCAINLFPYLNDCIIVDLVVYLTLATSHHIRR